MSGKREQALLKDQAALRTKCTRTVFNSCYACGRSCVIWRRGRIPEQWRVAEGVWIPKEENSKKIDQFRIIPVVC